jgi:hypothetical protein
VCHPAPPGRTSHCRLCSTSAPGFLDVLSRRYGFRYLITGAAAHYPGKLVAYQDASVKIYDLAPGTPAAAYPRISTGR